MPALMGRVARLPMLPRLTGRSYGVRTDAALVGRVGVSSVSGRSGKLLAGMGVYACRVDGSLGMGCLQAGHGIVTQAGVCESTCMVASAGHAPHNHARCWGSLCFDLALDLGLDAVTMLLPLIQRSLDVGWTTRHGTR